MGLETIAQTILRSLASGFLKAARAAVATTETTIDDMFVDEAEKLFVKYDLVDGDKPETPAA